MIGRPSSRSIENACSKNSKSDRHHHPGHSYVESQSDEIARVHAPHALLSRVDQLYAQDLLVVVVVMTYACVSPVVLIPALMFFSLARLVYRHQLL